MNKIIYSFDVFDTVITRLTGSPEIAFLLIGKRLKKDNLISCSPESFARLRISSERRAKAFVGQSMTIFDIYRELSLSLDLSNVEAMKIMDLEKEIQSKLLQKVPSIGRKIEKLRSIGSDIIFISDMHMNRDFIQAQLNENSVWKNTDRCYVSCEFGASKSTGELFRRVSEIEDVSIRQLSHFGNDLNGDVRVPESLGIETKFFNDGNLNRYEKILESFAWESEGLASVMAGASRLARLAVSTKNKEESAIRDVSAGVVSPILTGYVLWILLRAQKLGIKTLFFLSRDGQILLDIAVKLRDKLGIDCHLKYLYASRLSWNRATIKNIDEFWIWNPLKNFCSLEKLFKRLGIEKEEVLSLLFEYGYSDDDWERKLDSKEIRKLRGVLKGSKIERYILEKSKSDKETLDRYLDQEGVFENQKMGVVDLGWAGSLYSALTRIVDKKNAGFIYGFFFGKNISSEIDSECELLEAYYFDERVPQGIINDDIKNPLEIFCSADHGTVVGFEKLDNKIIPKLEYEEDKNVLNWGLPVLRKTVDSFCDYIFLDSNMVNPFSDLRLCCNEVFKAFWLNPTPTEAAVWGSYRWDDHVSGKLAPPQFLAKEYSWRDVYISFRKARYPKEHSTTWVRGSIEKSSPIIRLFLKIAIKMGKKFRS